ncbi:MAG TPA: hypothetical protein VHE34_18360 [Puia sp.]|uniref:hypothetical protein n=1 Tax=Puia sp. TaxID=2045100 RepID=UPI002BDA2FB9|nr:hypothetical protein [Puia sp.]HVU97202.1 hypothetical protein [Puia sp.]
MKVSGFLVIGLLFFSGSACSQTRADSSFSMFFNPGISFTRTNDEHINHWLAKYGYPAIPRVPSNYNFEVAAMPAYSRLLLSLRLSTINSVNNLSSFNIMGGLYTALIKKKSFLLFAGGATGLHRDIITLNGNLPPEYQQLATRVHSQLALRRAGLRLEPGVKVFWYPVQVGILQIGVSGGLTYGLDFNSHWKLGYYSNNHGRYGHFKGISRPSDQVKVSDHGLTYGGGLSFRFRLH